MTSTRMPREAKGNTLTLGLLLAVLMATCLMLTPRPAFAATFTVDRNDDPAPTTARGCTAASTGDLDVTGDLTITGCAYS